MSHLFKEIGGRCPFCDGLVNLIEGMVLDYNLDENGYPEVLNTESYRIAAYCINCAKQLTAMPNGMGGYNVYPINIMDNLRMLELIGISPYERISVISNKILNSTDSEVNPFTNVRQTLIDNNNESNEELSEEDIPF